MGKQILVVEDDAAIMETLSMFLCYEGYQVLRAHDVAEALDSIETEQPDLLLLDYMLHDETAEPVVEALRARNGREVPVILMTAIDNPVGRARVLGVEAVVPKPFELDVLLRVMRDCLSGVPTPALTRSARGARPAGSLESLNAAGTLESAGRLPASC